MTSWTSNVANQHVEQHWLAIAKVLSWSTALSMLILEVVLGIFNRRGSNKCVVLDTSIKTKEQYLRFSKCKKQLIIFDKLVFWSHCLNLNAIWKPKRQVQVWRGGGGTIPPRSSKHVAWWLVCHWLNYIFGCFYILWNQLICGEMTKGHKQVLIFFLIFFF